MLGTGGRGPLRVLPGNARRGACAWAAPVSASDPAARRTAPVGRRAVPPLVRSVGGGPPPDLSLDEVVDVAVEHSGRVAGLDVSACVLHQLVRMQHVVTHLVLPRAEARRLVRAAELAHLLRVLLAA